MHLSGLVLLLLTVCAAHGSRLPYALWQFGRMVTCIQPKVNPLIYMDYGCWCGMGGSGAPRDDVDSCCKVHDLCYEASRKSPECRPIADLPYIYFHVYGYSCSNRQVTCSASNDQCQARVCDCDRVASHCFAQSAYNPENNNLDLDVHCVDRARNPKARCTRTRT